jgi:hypothetical protein
MTKNQKKIIRITNLWKRGVLAEQMQIQKQDHHVLEQVLSRQTEQHHYESV